MAETIETFTTALACGDASAVETFYRRYFDTLFLMVQREVAERLEAAPGGRDYGLLSATAQLYGDVRTLFTLPPESFAPPPKVETLPQPVNCCTFSAY